MAAVRISYSRYEKLLGKDAEITKTAVMDKVHTVETEIPFEKPEKKKYLDYLYIEVDEDQYLEKYSQASTVLRSERNW